MTPRSKDPLVCPICGLEFADVNAHCRRMHGAQSRRNGPYWDLYQASKKARRKRTHLHGVGSEPTYSYRYADSDTQSYTSARQADRSPSAGQRCMLGLIVMVVIMLGGVSLVLIILNA
jgi:hypothetical protein